MNQHKTIAARLKAERGRLKMSQSEMAEQAGITRNTQGLYESGKRTPDGDYFAAIAKAGVDIAFVLVGGARLSVSITTNEIELIDRYRLSHRDVRRGVDALLAATSKTGDAE